MCGIIGLKIDNRLLSDGRQKRIVDKMFVLSERRGQDSTGISIWNYNDNIVESYKVCEKASVFVKSTNYKELVAKAYSFNTTTLIGHCRLATNGAASLLDNCQPLCNDKFALAHNGIIVNDKEIAKEYGFQNVDLDSMMLFNMLDFYSSDDCMSKKIEKMYEKINGAASVLVMDKDGIYAASNTGALYYYTNELKTIQIWASEKSIVEEVAMDIDYEFTSLQIINIMPSHLMLDGGEIKQIAYKSKKNDDYNGQHIQYKKMNLTKYNIDYDKINSLKRCKKCLLPETMPYIKYNNEGVCNYCTHYIIPNYSGEESLRREANRIKRDENGKILAAFSGGRDSSYSIHYLKKELGLNVVTYSYDWGMVTDIARRNQSRMCSALGVELITVSADIKKKRENIKKNISAWIKRPSLGMVPLFMAGDKQFFYYSNKVAKENGIKTVCMAHNRYEHTYFKYGFCNILPAILQDDSEIGVELLPKFGTTKMCLYYANEFIHNPSYINSSVLDTISAAVSNYGIPHDFLHFFNYVPWNEKKVDDLLINEYGWEIRPGSDSTWRIGDGTAPFYNLIYYTMCGFTENDCLRSNQIRSGLISRDEALKKSMEENSIPYDDLIWYFRAVGLDADEVITSILQKSPFLINR